MEWNLFMNFIENTRDFNHERMSICLSEIFCQMQMFGYVTKGAYGYF